LRYTNFLIIIIIIITTRSLSSLMHTLQRKYSAVFYFLGVIDHRTVFRQELVTMGAPGTVSDNFGGPGTLFRCNPTHCKHCVCLFLCVCSTNVTLWQRAIKIWNDAFARFPVYQLCTYLNTGWYSLQSLSTLCCHPFCEFIVMKTSAYLLAFKNGCRK